VEVTQIQAVPVPGRRRHQRNRSKYK
jgi:hypothetical protein